MHRAAPPRAATKVTAMFKQSAKKIRQTLLRAWPQALTLVFLVFVAACGGSKTTSTTTTATTGTTTGASSTVTCTSDSRVTPFHTGMKVAGAGGLYTFTITAMQPAPPTTGTATMTVQVTDKAGAAVTDATVGLALFMPDHGHSSSVEPQIAAKDGVYAISNVYLMMPGVWRMTFTATSADKAVTDSGVVMFCVPG